MTLPKEVVDEEPLAPVTPVRNMDSMDTNNNSIQMEMVFDDDDDDDDDEHSVSLEGSSSGNSVGDYASIAYSAGTGTRGREEDTQGVEEDEEDEEDDDDDGSQSGRRRRRQQQQRQLGHKKPIPSFLSAQESNITLNEFFQHSMNNGASDGVVCLKLLVVGMLIVASLALGSVPFVYTSSAIVEEYKAEVREFCVCVCSAPYISNKDTSSKL
jgi:hypothetical protein